jgi:ABC-2 type transport system permease protein
MVSLPLLRTNIKSNYIIWLIFIAILLMYFTIIVSMFDPVTIEGMDALLEALPPAMIDALNFKMADNTLLGFIAGYYYGFLILLFPLIYTVLMADRMIARYVDNGSMAFLLSTPNTRSKIALTQGVFLISSLIVLLAFLTLIGIVFTQLLFPGELDVGGFLLLNLGAVFLYFALSGVGFFASCLFNERKHSLALGGGLPVLFFLIHSLSNVGEEISFLKYFTLMSLFDTTEIITKGSGVLPAFAALFILGIVLYAAGVYVFSKKDLPL